MSAPINTPNTNVNASINLGTSEIATSATLLNRSTLQLLYKSYNVFYVGDLFLTTAAYGLDNRQTQAVLYVRNIGPDYLSLTVVTPAGASSTYLMDIGAVFFYFSPNLTIGSAALTTGIASASLQAKNLTTVAEVLQAQ